MDEPVPDESASRPRTPLDTEPAGVPLRRTFLVRAPERVWVTPTIIALNVIVFLVMIASGVSPLMPESDDILRFGSNHGPDIVEGQWWRLITAAFVHIGVLHIAFNMWAFYNLGLTVERLYGNGAFLVLYLLSAVGGSITSVFTHPAVNGAGASGAIFGVAGGMLAFFLQHKSAMPRDVFKRSMRGTLTFVGLNVVIGFSVPAIDNAAHLGGLATGFLAGLALNRDVAFAPNLAGARLLRALLVALLLAGIALLLPWRVRNDPMAGAEMVDQDVDALLATEDWVKALARLDQAIEIQPENSRAYELRAWVHMHRAEAELAIADSTRALGLDPERELALSVRAWFRMVQGDASGALKDLDRLVKLHPAIATYYTERGHVLYLARRWSDALRDFQSVAQLEKKDGEARAYLWLCRARLGLRAKADEELRGFLEGVESSQIDRAWRLVLEFLLGTRTEDELLRSFESGPAGDIVLAHFYAGSRQLVDGDLAQAREHFEICAAQHRIESREHWIARAELEQLGK